MIYINDVVIKVINNEPVNVHFRLQKDLSVLDPSCGIVLGASGITEQALAKYNHYPVEVILTDVEPGTYTALGFDYSFDGVKVTATQLIDEISNDDKLLKWQLAAKSRVKELYWLDNKRPWLCSFGWYVDVDKIALTNLDAAVSDLNNKPEVETIIFRDAKQPMNELHVMTRSDFITLVNEIGVQMQTQASKKWEFDESIRLIEYTDDTITKANIDAIVSQAEAYFI